MMVRSRKAGSFRGLIGERSGGAATEAALVLPALLLLLLSVMETGRFLWTQNALSFAVEEAARCASIRATACPTDAATSIFAAERALGLNVPASVFTVDRPLCGLRVSASLDFKPAAGAIVNYAIRLEASSCQPMES